MSYELYTADELAKRVFPSTFLVSPFLPRGGICFFHGKRGIGKSQFVLTLCSALAAQGDLFGFYPTHNYGSIVYVQADMGSPIQQVRVRRSLEVHPLPDVHFLFPRGFDLATVGHQTPMIQEITRLKPSLIVWDTLRRVIRLDTSTDIAAFIYGKVQEMFPLATHLFVHHDKKTVIDGDQLEEDELFSGSGGWIDAADAGLHLTEVARTKLRLSFTKVRTCEEQDPINLTMNPHTLLMYGGDRAESLLARYITRHPRATRQQVIDYLDSCFVAGPQIIEQIVEGSWNPVKLQLGL